MITILKNTGFGKITLEQIKEHWLRKIRCERFYAAQQKIVARRGKLRFKNT